MAIRCSDFRLRITSFPPSQAVWVSRGGRVPTQARCWLEWGSSELDRVFLSFGDFRIVYSDSTLTVLHSLLLVAKTLQSHGMKDNVVCQSE